MKKILSLLMVLCLVSLSSVAIAADQPFKDGVNYGQPFRGEMGAVPSMLNFGSAKRLSPGESLYDVKTKTVKKISASSLKSTLPTNTYYVYAKWQFAEAITSYEIEAMLVMTTPDGEYYATYDTWTITDLRRKAVCSWFFDVTDMLQRCLDEHDGKFTPGDYTFSLFLNDMAFRVTRVPVS